MSAYSKAIVATVVAALIAGLTAWQTAVSDGPVTAYEWATIVIAALGACGVYAVRNTDPVDPFEVDADEDA